MVILKSVQLPRDMKQPRLDLRHYQMIAVLAETPRVTDAAERLGITPSALSHRIREAERRLDVVLFNRVQKRLRMTPAGEHLALVASRGLAELTRAEEDAERMDRDVRQVVRIAVESYSSYHWLPAFLRHLREVESAIGLQVVAAAARAPLEKLHDRSVDLVILSGEAAAAAGEVFSLFQDELLFIMPPGHRLAGKGHIEGSDIIGEDFITTTRIPAPDREYAKLFRPSDSYPKWTETVEVPEAIVEMVAAGLGTSVLAGWALQGAIAEKRVVSARVGREGITLSWYAAIRKDSAPEAAATRRVAEVMTAWCAAHGGFPNEEKELL